MKFYHILVSILDAVWVISGAVSWVFLKNKECAVLDSFHKQNVRNELQPDDFHIEYIVRNDSSELVYIKFHQRCFYYV